MTPGRKLFALYWVVLHVVCGAWLPALLWAALFGLAEWMRRRYPEWLAD